jgi:subtilisin-like proprotein convertase family protein
LQFDATGAQTGPITLEEMPGTHIPDNKPAGIQRTLSTDASGSVSAVELSVDITHSWIGDLKVSLRSPAGTEVSVHNRSGRNSDNIKMTYTVSNTPALSNFAAEPIKGNWTLHVSDHAGADLGKLNAWRLVLHPAS